MRIEQIFNGLESLSQLCHNQSITAKTKYAHDLWDDMDSVATEAFALLKTHPEAQPNEQNGDGWISVNDKDNPPPEAKKVIAYLKLSGGDIIETAYYMGDDGWYYTGWEAPHHGVVTHWRPLPAPPKED